MSEQTFPDPPELLTVRETAWHLRSTEATVRALCHAGRLPAVRRGGPNSALLVPRRGLESYLYGPPAEPSEES